MAFENKEELGILFIFGCKTLKKAKKSPKFQIREIESKNTGHT
jgi:hypothetical protein